MAKRKPSHYAVKVGRDPGIYRTWGECQEQVGGYAGAVFKGFRSLAEAEAFLGLSPTLEGIGEPSGSGASAEAPEAESETESGRVVMYTDGACTGNPGPGGYGAVIKHRGKRKELAGGFAKTTNNRMELTACIAGLATLGPPCQVTLYTDSRYVSEAMTKGWAVGWRARGWQRKGKPVPNADLWTQLLDLCSRHEVTFEWVRGHAGNRENERCDELACRAARAKGLPADEGYRDQTTDEGAAQRDRETGQTTIIFE